MHEDQPIEALVASRIRQVVGDLLALPVPADSVETLAAHYEALIDHLLEVALVETYTLHQDAAQMFVTGEGADAVRTTGARYASLVADELQPALLNGLDQMIRAFRAAGRELIAGRGAGAERDTVRTELRPALDRIEIKRRGARAQLRQFGRVTSRGIRDIVQYYEAGPSTPAPSPPILATSIWKHPHPVKVGPYKMDTTIERSDDTVTVAFPKTTVTLPLTQEWTKDHVKVRAYDYNGQGGDELDKQGGTSVIHWGYYKVIELVPDASNPCTEWAIVQLRRLKGTAQGPPPGAGQPRPAEIQIAPPAGEDPDAWKVDVPARSVLPTQPKIGDTNAMIDLPGMPNPWKAGPAGTDLKVVTLFRTWVVCCKPTRQLLGYCEWGTTLTMHTGTETGGTSATIAVSSPINWHPNDPSNADYAKAEADFQRIVNRQAYPAFC